MHLRLQCISGAHSVYDLFSLRSCNVFIPQWQHHDNDSISRIVGEINTCILYKIWLIRDIFCLFSSDRGQYIQWQMILKRLTTSCNVTDIRVLRKRRSKSKQIKCMLAFRNLFGAAVMVADIFRQGHPSPSCMLVQWRNKKHTYTNLRVSCCIIRSRRNQMPEVRS